MKQIILLLSLFYSWSSFGQQKGDCLIGVINEKKIRKIERSLQLLKKKVERNTVHTLMRLQKQEDRLKKKLTEKDSSASQKLFKAGGTFKDIASGLKSSAPFKKFSEYIPEFDSLKTMFNFLDQSKRLTARLPANLGRKIQGTNNSIRDFEDKLAKAFDINAHILERKQQIKDELEKYGLQKRLAKLNKEVYYYQQQLNEYRTLLRDPKKLQQKALAQLRKLPAFKDFMRNNSQLVQLFRIPNPEGRSDGISGLQTRDAIQAFLQQKFIGTGTDPQRYIKQQMPSPGKTVNNSPANLIIPATGSSVIAKPDFKPNKQKTKTFLARIEYGANTQSQQAQGILPATSDLTVNAGYRFNDRNIAGFGVGYKLGWGKSIRQVRLSNQGIGIRGYVDITIGRRLSLTGGYEKNYRNAFTKISELNQYDAWQTSGLVGLTRKYKLAKRANNFQLLWDFLSYRQLPRTQPILLRIGFTINK